MAGQRQTGLTFCWWVQQATFAVVSVDSELTGSSGLFNVGTIFNEELGWILRPQPDHDWGIDAIAEQKAQRKATGLLVALQIKSGPKYFRKQNPRGGWTLFGPKRNLEYWLAHSLPVIVVLYDPRSREAYWVHVNADTARFTPHGYAIEVPSYQRLTRASAVQLTCIAERWTPVRGDVRSRSLARISQLLADGVPVHPTPEMFDKLTCAPNNYVPIKSWFYPAVAVYNLHLAGDAPASGLEPGLTTVQLPQLRGTWWVAPGTEVYVCENHVVLQAVGAALGSGSPPLVCLGGFPNRCAEYLLLGLGACGAQVRVHTDHDEVGSRIARTLFHRTFDYELWCPRDPTTDLGNDGRHEENCLPAIIKTLASAK